MLAKAPLSRSRGCVGAGCPAVGRLGSRIKRAAVPDEPLYPPLPTVDEYIQPKVENYRAEVVPEQQVKYLVS